MQQRLATWGLESLIFSPNNIKNGSHSGTPVVQAVDGRLRIPTPVPISALVAHAWGQVLLEIEVRVLTWIPVSIPVDQHSC